MNVMINDTQKSPSGFVAERTGDLPDHIRYAM